jgi:hypothetical protein
MKKEILISLIVLTLVGCGGESTSHDIDGINQDFSINVRGEEQEPSLSLDTVTEGDNVSLNTILNGSVLENSSIRFNFTSNKSQKVALVLSSAVEDLDLNVSGQDVDFDGSGNSSNEAILFNALAGQIYSIEVDSYSGSGEFQLKLVAANRSSLGLSANEYIIQAEYNSTEVCLEDGLSYTFSDIFLINTIINWKGGYISDLDAIDKTSFTSADGEGFTIVETDSKSENGESYESIYTLNYATNFDINELTGTLVSKTTYTDFSGTKVCDATVNIVGKVIL